MFPSWQNTPRFLDPPSFPCKCPKEKEPIYTFLGYNLGTKGHRKRKEFPQSQPPMASLERGTWSFSTLRGSWVCSERENERVGDLSQYSSSLNPFVIFLDLPFSGKANHPHSATILISFIFWHYLQEHN